MGLNGAFMRSVDTNVLGRRPTNAPRWGRKVATHISEHRLLPRPLPADAFRRGSFVTTGDRSRPILARCRPFESSPVKDLCCHARRGHEVIAVALRAVERLKQKGEKKKKNERTQGWGLSSDRLVSASATSDRLCFHWNDSHPLIARRPPYGPLGFALHDRSKTVCSTI